MTQQRKKCGKGGFTLVELVVTLVILSILFAIAVPSLLGYIHLSQFRKNESYAKTMYLSAESELTYLRTGGEWESFCSKVKKEGVLNQSFDESDEDRKKLVGRIYGIRLDAGEYAEGELSGDGALVGALLSQDTYDKSVLNAAICIEIDVESGQVYSVFYGTNCKGLYYGSNEDSKPADMSGSWLDIDYSKRDRDTRQKEQLGYYSVQDAVNAVSLDATKLKITSINLVNGETLSLNWSSNVKDQDLDKVYYEVKLYSSEDKAQLLSINIPGRNLKTGSQSVAVTTEDNATKDYTFPVEYDRSNKRATLVLDGMMNAKLYDRLDKLSADNKAAFRQSSDTSITRFGGKLEKPLNVYAAVQVFPDPNAENTGGEEYQKSDAIESNKANTLFGDGTRSDNSRYEIETFRHLSNIRYMDTEAAFAVTARSLDWTSDSVKVYGTAARGALSVSAGKDIGFPSIPALRSNQTLDGTGGLLNRIAGVFTGGNTISNLKLDETSIADDAEYLGLFRKNAGTIYNLRLLNPQVEIASDKLKGVGAVCGYSNGSLKGDNVDGTQARVEAALTSAQAQGIGGVAGVIEVSDSKSVIKLSASGTVTGTLPTGDTARGIGGIAGSLTTNGAAVKTLTNSAAVTGNRSVGGIAGYFSGKDQATGKDMADCQNEGLILSSIAADDHSLAGHYIGGIVGYAHNASLSECRSRAGYADGYTYKQEDRDKLRGRYVGGIVGYGEQSVLYDCETEANGYVLGSEYVGGIIGALNQSDTQTALLSENGTRTTVNASYVIGNSYVGGIIGENKGGSTIKNCVNTGVAAGYDAYIGGICGANENHAAIINCASYVSDTNNAIYRRVTDWGAVGSYAGGLTGYNSGTITFSDKDNAVSNRSVAGIVVGMNESEKDLSFLLNRAFVGRQLKQQNTSRFAGGIIGTQSNKTTSDWTIENCINYGTVYGYLSHYSGGIVGQWTNNGGTVEDCYNYGNLQTTYAANWVGASGGIVAQLYHAASGQDFNILSCQNHGSIYGRWGDNTSYSANDSAGILGNITAYTASSAAMGQQFNINVVDCLNAPGVKIYSGSMASGIVGFFSVDNATSNNGASITASTANIVLNIDRCRNYAYTDDLVGTNFRAGIFGDRYGSAATQNTYIQNCYSVPIRSDNGIISFQTGRSTRLDVNRVGNNYYFFDTWGLTESGNTAGITYKTDEARNNGAGESRRGYARMAAYGEFDGKFYAAIVGPRLDPTLNLTQNEDARTKCGIYYNMTDSNTRVENGILISKFNDGTEKITGRILFEMPPDYSYDQVRTWHANNLMPAISQKTGKLNNLSGGKIMDDYVREAYRTMEHGQTDKKLDTSFTVDLKQQTDGSFDVSIEDTDRPLYYEGTVLVDGKEVMSNLRFIPNQKGQGQWDPKLNGIQAYGSGTTTGTFQLPASLAADTAGKTITLSVRAVSLYEDTAPSAWKTAATQNVSVLPTPDVNIRLVSHWNNGAKYQISLKNLADYAVFSNWKVTFRLGSQTVTIDQNNHTAEISGDDLKELIVTAAAGITNGIQPASVTDTIPTDTPKYKPDGSINQLSVSYSGSTVDDCTVTAALTVNEPQMETPPIYRIEVLGTVGTNEYVFAYEDVLTSAGNTVTANFRDLPKEYFAENVTNRRVRAWYAASGLGPVYTYGDTWQTGDASVTLRTYSAEGVQQQDKTIYSHVLGHATDFANYIRAAALNIKPLTAPELNDPVLKQEDNGSISYRFSWTQPGQGTAVPHYSVKLTGITAAGARIGIPVNEVYGTQENPNTSQSFTINADDWQYAEVELTVTRLGQAYGEVGLSTTKKYAVKQRLERPGQPLVINPDTNELEYTIGWSAIGSENGCAGYQIYVQPEGETAAALGALVPVRGGTCSVSRSLEDYAGKTIDLYLVAVAADDSGYADSPNGIVYTMTVPMRLDTPSVKWSYNWNATANNPIPAADFRSGGLQVTVTPENAASVPPGGSTYLLRTKITGTDGTTVTYPVSAMSESGGSYVCSLTDLDTKYAGCSVRFEARISQSAGQVSSAWVSSGDVVFPRVKLEAPSASLANVNETLTVSYGPMNRLINTAEWDAQLTAFSWDEVAEADLYRIELTDKDDKSTTVTVDMSGNLPEIIMNGQNTFVVAGDDWYTVKQGSAVNGRYSLTNGSIRYYSYQPDTMLQVKDGTFTLKLPNIFSVVTHENQTLQLTNGIQISRVTVIADSKSDRYTESDPAERRF